MRKMDAGSARHWDQRRNTSQLQPVPPDALPNARRALSALRRAEAALVAWIEEGYPLLTEDEHIARFGEPWQAPSSSRRRKA
jgi:hypothetical protein